MAMVHGIENTAEHFGFTYTRKLNRLKIIFWNLDQLGNPPDKFFQSPEEDGYMKTAYRGLFLAGKKSVL